MKLRRLLTFLNPIYGAVIRARFALYEKGVFKSFDLQVPTISVGNITVGGTGKTPLVAFVADILAKKGEKVCILTRGYGRENPKERVLVSDGETIFADALEAGDEPFELANNLLGKAAVIADAKRAEAGIWARENWGITVFILDDGFQHLRVKRDLDIVLLDATNPFGNGKLLPAGILRESLESLKRADVVVITRANLVDESGISNIKYQVSNINPKCKIFVSENKTIELTKLKDFSAKAQNLQIKNIKLSALHSPLSAYCAFCALGNPENFYEQLRRENFNLVYTKNFSDHHFYSQSEITKLEKEAVANGAEILLTTAKDAVKLAHLKFNFPCYVVESRLIFDDESAFIALIQNLKSKISNQFVSCSVPLC